jgi:hypothetical protein
LARIDPQSKKSPDLNIVDEGLFSTLLAGEEKTYARLVDQLRPQGEFGGVVRGRRRQTVRTATTADLYAGRAELCRVLEARHGPLVRDLMVCPQDPR